MKFAIDKNAINASKTILEFGAGNLRNALYVINIFPNIVYYVVEKKECSERFSDNYNEFIRKGGRILQNRINKINYDILICTFVLETICPFSQRIKLLKTLSKRLTKYGELLASFRGYPGIKGSRYIQCQAKEGYITPLKTFVTGHSIPEVKLLLTQAGYKKVNTLQKYKVESPQNIHVLAEIQ